MNGRTRVVAWTAALLVVGGVSVVVANAAPNHSKVEPLLGHRWRVVRVAQADEYRFSVHRSSNALLNFAKNRVINATTYSFGARVQITPVKSGYRSEGSSGTESSGPISKRAREIRKTMRHVADPAGVTRVARVSPTRFRLTSGHFTLICVLTHEKPSSPSPSPSSPTSKPTR